MASRIPFSLRYETRRPEGGLILDAVPGRVRDGLLNILDTGLTPLGDAYSSLGSFLCHRLDLRLGHLWGQELPYTIVRDAEWDEFLDACECVWEWFSESERPDLADWFSNKLNDLFGRNYVGYELRDGLIERVGARVQDEAIAKARGILRDPDLAGPDEQFQKAIGFYNRRPEPDCENCVKEAVSAVEGVARIVLADHSLTLSDALKRLRKERDVHPTLIIMLEKLYAYRGDAEGVGHALTGDQEVRLEEAEFVLGVSASAIVYLARLYGRGVE